MDTIAGRYPGVDTTTSVRFGWISSKVEETSHDETDDERMSRGYRGIRLSRPTGRPVAVESVEEERVAERLKGSRSSSMPYHDLMGRVMSRVVGTLLARSTLLTSVAAALVVLFCCCRCTRASEFPERECCDLVYPISEPTGRSTSAPTPTGRSGKFRSKIYSLNIVFRILSGVLKKKPSFLNFYTFRLRSLQFDETALCSKYLGQLCRVINKSALVGRESRLLTLARRDWFVNSRGTSITRVGSIQSRRSFAICFAVLLSLLFSATQSTIANRRYFGTYFRRWICARWLIEYANAGKVVVSVSGSVFDEARFRFFFFYEHSFCRWFDRTFQWRRGEGRGKR